MTKWMLWVATGINLFTTVVWTVNFFHHWHRDGMIKTSTALFGVAAVCFGIMAVLCLIRIRRIKKEEK